MAAAGPTEVITEHPPHKKARELGCACNERSSNMKLAVGPQTLQLLPVVKSEERVVQRSLHNPWPWAGR
ncbi:hypothetical protein NDU88_005216 [Pleurodeles waltl]|uniref:Uncharacterized protein n=1 Tax=Pleurodeles waltl TaxID=8319 RepID=A0AAV7RLH0_PLEWA|nr:hypothetical protein NDU88_005216 [Pleurodeles waltl]